MPTNDQYSYDLASARAQNREVREIQNAAGRVAKPLSGIVYAFLYVVALIGDIVDIADIDVVTGVGIAISLLVDLIIGTILFFAGRAARDRIKTMNDFQDELHNKIEQIEKKIVAYRNAYARVLQVSRKVKILRKPVRKMALRFARLRKSVRLNPLTKTIYAVIADFVPYLSLVPWRTINIYMMRRDELRAFQEAQNMLPEYVGAKADEAEAAYDLQEAEMIEQAV